MNWNGWRTRISPPDASTMSSDECYSAILKMCEQPVSNPLDTERERGDGPVDNVWQSRAPCVMRSRGGYTLTRFTYAGRVKPNVNLPYNNNTQKREREGLIPPDKPTFTSFFFSLFYRQSTNILIKLNFEFGAYKLCTYYKAASINGSFVIFGWQTKQSLLNNSDDDDDIHYADCEGEGRIQKRGTRRCIIADTVVGLGTCHCCCCPCCCS